MKGFSFYYIEANLVCAIVFGIILLHNHFNIDRQEKQIKFDHALIAFIVYFLTDSVWAGIVDGLFPKALYGIVNFMIYISMPSFLCRYGGDEFILIAHPQSISEIDGLIGEIREEVHRARVGYPLSISAGYDELQGGTDTIQRCIQRADKKLYMDKRRKR